MGERQQFEKWATVYFNARAPALEYLSGASEAWAAWQAARRASPTQGSADPDAPKCALGRNTAYVDCPCCRAASSPAVVGEMPPDVAEQFKFFRQLASDPDYYKTRMGKLLDWMTDKLDPPVTASVSASHVPDADGVLGTPNDQQEGGA